MKKLILIGVFLPTIAFAQPECGDPTGDGTFSATDALIVALTSVDLDICVTWYCDINGDGAINATDVRDLIALAINLPILVSCPDPMVQISIEEAASQVAALRAAIDYSTSGILFVGAGADVLCTNQDPDFSSFNNLVETSELVFASISFPAGLLPGSIVAVCEVTTETYQVEEGNFSTSILEAAGPAPDFTPIEPLPVLGVSILSVPNTTSTTSTTNTSTTTLLAP
jgi:hypothetical protein